MRRALGLSGDCPDLHDALTETLWEGLAAAAVESVLVAATEPAVEARLVRAGPPVSRGPAHRRRSRWWARKPTPSLHEVRMRGMWGC